MIAGKLGSQKQDALKECKACPPYNQRRKHTCGKELKPGVPSTPFKGAFPLPAHGPKGSMQKVPEVLPGLPNKVGLEKSTEIIIQGESKLPDIADSEDPAEPRATEVSKPVSAGESPAGEKAKQEPKAPVTDKKEKVSSPEPLTSGVPPALARLHKRLNSEVELYKLHLKHYHMSLRSFKQRTSCLALPQVVYDKFERIINNCTICSASKPAPMRARVSGLRAENFGDLLFVDHAEFTLKSEGNRTKYVALLVLDAATNLLAVIPQTTASAVETLEAFRKWICDNNCVPKQIVGDMAFSGEAFENFYKFRAINFIPTGPRTPWPNRAESAVRLFKTTVFLLAKECSDEPGLPFPSFRQLCMKANWARNIAPMLSGKSPLECATGRRPPPLLDVETANPEQLTLDPSPEDMRDKQLQKLALRAHLEARQQEDLMRDLAKRVQPSEGIYSQGERCFFWVKDPNKIKDRGAWHHGRVLAHIGPMVTIETATAVVKLNQCKVRRNRDEWHDFVLPEELEKAVVQPPPEADDPGFVAPEGDTDLSPDQEFAHPDAQSSHSPQPTSPEGLLCKTCGPLPAFWQVSTDSHVDFMEIFAGSQHLSQSIAEEGFKVGPPVDLNTGYDILTPTGRQRTWDLIVKHNPRVIWLAPVCTPWSNLQNIQKDQEKVAHNQHLHKPMVRFAAAVAQYQVDNGRYFVLEDPKTSKLWYQPCLNKLWKNPKVHTGDTDLCMHGMKDPVSKLPMKKSLTLMHNFVPGALDLMFLRCSTTNKKHHPEHQPVEGGAPGHGSRTKLTQVYPFGFCRRFARCLQGFFRSTKEPAVSSRHIEFVQSLFGEDIVQSEIRQLDQWLDGVNSGHVLGPCPTGCVLSAESPDSLGTPLKVRDDKVKLLMAWVNALAKGTELDMNASDHPWSEKLIPLIKALRTRFLPNHGFLECRILRGTLGSVKSIFQLEDPARVVLWHKNAKSKELFVVPVSTLQNDSSFDATKWSIIVFFEDTTPGHDVKDKPVPMNTAPGPSPDGGPPPAPPPLPPPAGPPPGDEPMDDDLDYGDPDAPMLGLQPGIGEMSDPIHVDNRQVHGGEPGKRPRASSSSNPETVARPRTGPSNNSPDAMPHPFTPLFPNVPMDHWMLPDIRTPGDGTVPIEPFIPWQPSADDDSAAPAAVPYQPPVTMEKGQDSDGIVENLAPADEDNAPAPSGHHHTSSSSGPSGPATSTEGDNLPNEPSSSSAPPATTTYPPEPESITPCDPAQHDSDADDEFESCTDLYVDEHPGVWQFLSAAMKQASNTASFCVCGTSKGDKATSEALFAGHAKNWYTNIHEVLSASQEGPRSVLGFDARKAGAKKKKAAARKEASSTELRGFQLQFIDAKKAECKSWHDNEVFELVDMRKHKPKNYVTGRWVLTVKREQDGSFQKCKARWVLRGFQDRQKWDQQTDSPTATRPAFRLGCQHLVNQGWNTLHIDLKTAFLQGEDYDSLREVVCQLPPEMGYPPYIGAYLKKPAYGMNDAPRRWWNRIDKSLHDYGMVPARADRCCYLMYGPKVSSGTRPYSHRQPTHEAKQSHDLKKMALDLQSEEGFLEYILDPVTGSPSRGKQTEGFVCLHVDDLFASGTPKFLASLKEKLKKDYQIGSETYDNIMFCGQRVRWQGNVLVVDQDRQVDELSEIKVSKGSPDSQVCSPQMHTEYRSVLGMLNWLQSRTQYHICYRFSRAASAAASPTILDVRELNKVVRVVRALPVKLTFWPLKGSNLRILGYPDAAFKNNKDGSSQRGQVIFIAEGRRNTAASQEPVRGSMVDYESTKIKRTTLSTTVAELYSFMKCFGTCQFLRGLWCDISSAVAPVHIRTDANNLVTTAGTTHLPEQKETVHMIQMLRKEACSGAIDDLAHIPTEYCLADPMTKSTISADELVKSINTGKLLLVDAHPLFRSLHKHKAFESEAHYIQAFLSLGEPRPFVKDSWELKGNTLLRHHADFRKAMFDPSLSKDIPVDVSRLYPQRRMHVHYVDGNAELIEDTWLVKGNSTNQLPLLSKQWRGITEFWVKIDTADIAMNLPL